MTAAKPSLSPVEVASSAGAAASSWHKLGDGPWSGTVRLKDDRELEITELASSWKATDETGRTSSARTLEQLLKQVTRPVARKKTR